MNPIVEKYKDLQVVSNEPQLREMSMEIANAKDKGASVFAQEPTAGGFFLYDNQIKYPGVVLEHVAGHMTDDSISCLYKTHQAFASKGALLAARKEVIKEIMVQHGADPSMSGNEGSFMGLFDPSRKRIVLVNEMCLAQLIDFLADKTDQKHILAPVAH